MTQLDTLIEGWRGQGFSAEVVELACQTPFIAELANIKTPAPAPIL